MMGLKNEPNCEKLPKENQRSPDATRIEYNKGVTTQLPNKAGLECLRAM